MIWLTWRQARGQAVTAAAALAVFAVLLAATGPHLASLYAASGITGCHGGTPCDTAASHFLSRLAGTSPYPVVYLLGIALILAAPAIIGIFWGAPLIARELESRTFTLAWNQSITRTRWLAVKLALTGLAAMAITEALSLMYAWWADPISKARDLAASVPGLPHPFTGGPLSSWIFATSGITPPERTVVSGPAFFESAGLSVGTLQATTVPGQPSAWILSSAAINAAGQPVSTIPAPCLGPPGSGKGAPTGAGACMASRGIREAITYQPASRYWPLQWIETAIFLVVALALAGCCFWRTGCRRIRRTRFPGRAAAATYPASRRARSPDMSAS